MLNLTNLSQRLNTLVIFRHLLSEPILAQLKDCIDCLARQDKTAALSAYGGLVQAV